MRRPTRDDFLGRSGDVDGEVLCLLCLRERQRGPARVTRTWIPWRRTERQEKQELGKKKKDGPPKRAGVLGGENRLAPQMSAARYPLERDGAHGPSYSSISMETLGGGK